MSSCLISVNLNIISVVCVIPNKDCYSIYIGEIGRSIEILLKNVSAFKKGNINSKIV